MNDSSAAPDGEFEKIWKTLSFSDRDAKPAVRATVKANLGTADTLAAMPFAPESVAQNARLPKLTLGGTGRTLGGAGISAEEAAPTLPDGEGLDLEIIRTLGEGGMGLVQLARQPALAREVAVKTVRPELRDAAGVVGLLTEAQTIGALEHPNILPVHILGQDREGGPLLVMKRIEGVGWHDLIADRAHPVRSSHPRFQQDELVVHLEILIEVCDAIHFAHSRGIIHRDIKPENVMLGQFGEVYVMDWGIAAKAEDVGPASTKPRTVSGTPAYMAPEMVKGKALDARTDVYLLGATLHEVLTGKPRHDAATLQMAMLLAYESVPHKYGPEVPEELAALCNRACALNPDDRPASAMEFCKAVREFLTHRTSLDLAEEATRKLDELHTLIEGAGDAQTDVARYAELSGECRFGFTQALRAWPGNERAAKGLRAALTLLAGHELRQENAAGARALLTQIKPAEPALEAKLRKLEERLKARAEDAAKARRIAEDMDARVGGQQRLALAGTLTVLVAIVSAYFVRASMTTAGRGERHQQLVGIWLGVSLLLGVVIALWRKTLLKNALGRRTMAMFAFGVGAVLVHRVAASHLGAAVSITLVGDLLLLSATTFAGALGTFPRLWIAGVCLAIGALVLSVVPSTAVVVFPLAILVAVGVMAWVWRSAEGESPAEPEPTLSMVPPPPK